MREYIHFHILPLVCRMFGHWWIYDGRFFEDTGDYYDNVHHYTCRICGHSKSEIGVR